MSEFLSQNKGFKVGNVGDLIHSLLLCKGSSQPVDALVSQVSPKFLRSVPNVRFVPKKSSVRAITNLRTRRGRVMGRYGGGEEVLTNSALYNCMHVLKHQFNLRPSLAGFGVFGLDDIYAAIRSYKLRNEKKGFFIGVLDLEKCYDNVDTKLLYDTVSQVLNGDDDDAHSLLQEPALNLIHKYAVCHSMASMNKVMTKTLRIVSRSGNVHPCSEAAAEIAAKYRNSLISDGVVYPKISNKEALRLIKIHLFSHIVRIPAISSARFASKSTSSSSTKDSAYFTQIKGIPQGSVLSPLLCNIYYGNAEKIVFGSEESAARLGIDDGRTVVLRLMDDYIVISTEQSCAQYFLQRAHQCLKPFGGGARYILPRPDLT